MKLDSKGAGTKSLLSIYLFGQRTENTEQPCLQSSKTPLIAKEKTGTKEAGKHSTETNFN